MSQVISFGVAGLDRLFDADAGADASPLWDVGGPAANVAGAMTRLGFGAAFVGGLSADAEGKHIRQVLHEEGVDLTGAARIDTLKTRTAAVRVGNDGERALISLDTAMCADWSFTPEHLSEAMFAQAKALYIDSTTMSHEPVASAAKRVLELAQKYKLLCVFDANIRIVFWKDRDCRKAVLAAAEQAHVFKVNKPDLQLLTGETGATKGLTRLRELLPQPALLIATLGDAGAAYMQANSTVERVDVVSGTVKDTAAAGDTFTAVLLFQLLQAEVGGDNVDQVLSKLPAENLRKMFERCAKGSAYCVSRLGALLSAPRHEDVF